VFNLWNGANNKNSDIAILGKETNINNPRARVFLAIISIWTKTLMGYESAVNIQNHTIMLKNTSLWLE
jgi:hypothetical protein